MTSKEHLKKELMVFAINHDFFGYGSCCKKLSNGRYVSIVDSEKAIYSGKELAAEFDTLDQDEKKNIIDYYFEKELL